MKKFGATVLLLALGLALLLTSVPTKNVGAQGRSDDPGKKPARRSDGKIVAPDGVVFESSRDFVEAGRKCSTRQVDEEEMAEIADQVKASRAAGGRKPGDGGGEGARIYPNGSINIPVYFHVVYRSDGVGNISETWLDNQINAMNEHYTGLDTPAYRTAAANTSFRFFKAGVTRTQNDSWYNAGPGSSRGNIYEERATRWYCRRSEFLYEQRRWLSRLGHIPVKLRFPTKEGRRGLLLGLAPGIQLRSLQRGRYRHA